MFRIKQIVKDFKDNAFVSEYFGNITDGKTAFRSVTEFSER